MCLEESFCPFTRDALNFRQPEIYAAPHHPAVSRCPLSFNRHHCAVWRSALSFCSVTTHAHRKSRVRSNNVPTRKVYVTLGLWRWPCIATGGSACDVTHSITSIIQSFVNKCNNSNSCKLFYLDYKSANSQITSNAIQGASFRLAGLSARK